MKKTSHVQKNYATYKKNQNKQTKIIIEINRNKDDQTLEELRKSELKTKLEKMKQAIASGDLAMETLAFKINNQLKDVMQVQKERFEFYKKVKKK